MKQNNSRGSRRIARWLASAAVVSILPIPLAPAAHAATNYDPPVTLKAPKSDTFKAFRTRWTPDFILDSQPRDERDIVEASVTLTQNTPGTTFSIAYVAPGAKLNYGYSSFSRITSVTFSASIRETRNMLRTIKLEAGEPGKVTFTVSLTAQESTVVYEPWQSRYYEFVPAPSIKWTDALAQASTRTFRGVPGHLAAIETERENEFIAANIGNAANVWIAGTDKDNEGEFKWAAGSSAGQTFWKARCAANAPGSVDSCTGANNIVTGGQANGIYGPGVIDQPLINTFAPWDSFTKEPNNWGGLNVAQGGENFVATNWKGTYGLWNDLPENTKSISGYLVEFPNAPNKAFAGVIQRSVTHTITEERSDFAARNVKAVETAVPGEYTVTWDEPKAFSNFFLKAKAKKVFDGYEVESDNYSFPRCFVKRGQPRTCTIRGFLPKVSPIFSVSAEYSKTPEFLKKIGQRTFGVGAKGTPSSVPKFISLNLKGGYRITSGSTLTVSATGLAPLSSWNLKNFGNGRTVMSGTTSADGTIQSQSVALPIPTATTYRDPDPYVQVNLVLTYVETSGRVVELPYSYKTFTQQLVLEWNALALNSGGTRLTTWPAIVN